MFKIECKLNDDDYIMFNEYYLLNSISGKKLLITMKILPPVISLLVILALYFAGADRTLILIEFVIFIMLSIVWMFFAKKVFLYFFKRSVKKLKKEGKLPYSNEETLTFDDDFINTTSQYSEGKIKYTCVEKCCVSKKAIYIYVSAAQAIIVPFSAFHDETEKQKFIKFINSKI